MPAQSVPIENWYAQDLLAYGVCVPSAAAYGTHWHSAREGGRLALLWWLRPTTNCPPSLTNVGRMMNLREAEKCTAYGAKSAAPPPPPPACCLANSGDVSQVCQVFLFLADVSGSQVKGKILQGQGWSICTTFSCSHLPTPS